MIRKIIIILVLVILSVITAILVFERSAAPVKPSLESFFRVLGKPVKTLDRLITKIIMVNNEEERKLGELLAQEYKQDYYFDPKDIKIQERLQSLLDKLAADYNPKKFKWKINLYYDSANAFALPGGVIYFSKQLYDLLDNEAEIVAILAHEKGHIDLGHCIDLYRKEAKRGSISNLGSIETIITSLPSFFMSIAYSKYAEDEADQYAFETLIRLGYSPFALSATFKKLYSLNENNKSKSNILIDFFKTHPSLPIRIENWHEAAVRFSKLHPNFHEGR